MVVIGVQILAASVSRSEDEARGSPTSVGVHNETAGFVFAKAGLSLNLAASDGTDDEVTFCWRMTCVRASAGVS